MQYEVNYCSFLLKSKPKFPSISGLKSKPVPEIFFFL